MKRFEDHVRSLKTAECDIGGGAIALRADVSRLPEIESAMAQILVASERGSVAQSLFTEADAHRLDVELLLEPLENLVADRTIVP
jgi:hypothetical protein